MAMIQKKFVFSQNSKDSAFLKQLSLFETSNDLSVASPYPPYPDKKLIAEEDQVHEDTVCRPKNHF